MKKSLKKSTDHREVAILQDHIDWTVRLVLKGDHYGLDDVLTHTGIDPLVEFYDRRYMHTEFGQFVSRYYLSTLYTDRGGSFVSRQARGLDLHGGVPDWSISAEGMTLVYDWLDSVIH